MADLLTKLFVRVPAGTPETLDNIKAKSLENNKKIYFVEDLNQIVLNGITYGVDPKSSKEIVSLINAIGGSVAEDGTVTVDFSSTNYVSEASNIVAAIVALDAKLKGELGKLASSKTLNESYEFTGKLKYVPAVKDSSVAYIVMTDEDNHEIPNTKINISDIIGNGVLDHSEYIKETGILHLWFKQADGSTRDEQINLAEMLDIDDVLVKSGSENYLEVANTTKISGYRLIAEPHTEITVEAYNSLPEGEKAKYEAINEHGFEIGTKIVTMNNAAAAHDDVLAVTGLADALDVKTYIDSKTNGLAVTAEGDEYVGASVNADVDNKHVIVAANVKGVSAYVGTRGTWSVSDDGVATRSDYTAPSILGVANSLMDGAQAIDAIKTYIDAVVADEAAERIAKISAAVKALDVTAQTKGTNVRVTVSETDGKVALDSVVEDYATVTRTPSTSSDVNPKTDADIVVKLGDEGKLVKASDLKAVADYAADKVTEEAHRVDNLTSYATGANTGNNISVRVDSKGGKVTGVTVEFDPWETYTV